MKKRVLILSFLAILIVFALYVYNDSFRQKKYKLNYKKELSVEMKASCNWGLMQSSGYNIEMNLVNKTSGISNTFNLNSDVVQFDFYVSDIIFNTILTKTFVVHDLYYDHYSFYDYEKLFEIEAREYNIGEIEGNGISIEEKQELLKKQIGDKPARWSLAKRNFNGK